MICQLPISCSPDHIIFVQFCPYYWLLFTLYDLPQIAVVLCLHCVYCGSASLVLQHAARLHMSHQRRRRRCAVCSLVLLRAAPGWVWPGGGHRPGDGQSSRLLRGNAFRLLRVATQWLWQACRLLIFLTACHCVQLTPVATVVASCRLLVSSRQTGACWGDGALEAALGRRLDILGWSRN